MRHPQYRRLRSALNKTVLFQQDPSNPITGLSGVVISLLAAGWGKYIIAGVHDAMDSIENADLGAERSCGEL